MIDQIESQMTQASEEHSRVLRLWHGIRSARLRLLVLLFGIVAFVPGHGQALELALDVHDSFLWAEGNSLSSQAGLVAVGSPNGLRLYEESVNGTFAFVGEHKVPSGVHDLVLRNSIVYYVDDLGVAAAVDVTDPSHPDALGDFGPPEPVTCLTLNGDWLITAGSGKVSDFSLTDPHHPILAGEWFYAGPTVDITARDSLVLLLQGTDGILAGVRHPDGTLTGAGRFYLPNPAPGFPINEAATNGRYVWVPHGTDGVLVIDFADPYNPASSSQIVTFGRVEHVSLAGDRLLVADAIIGLISYRLLIPEVPFWQNELSSLRTIKTLWPGTSNRFYATEGADMFAIDVSPLGKVGVAGRVGLPGGYNRFVRFGDWALLPDDGGLWEFNGHTADADSALHRIISGRSVYDAELCKNRLFTADGPLGATINSISEFGTLSPIRTVPPQHSSSTGISVTHDTLIVIENGEGFQIFDITNIFNPNFLGRARLSRQFPAAAFPVSRFLYLSEQSGPVGIWDLRYPAKPGKVGSLPGASSVQQMTLEGKRLYSADPSGVAVFDIANPAAPSMLYRYPAPASANAFYRSGRTLYTGDASGHISAVDIAHPSSTPVIATANLIGSVKSITKFGERLWITTDAAVYAVDVVPPLLPGDFDSDGDTDVLDMTALIDYTFAGGSPSFRPNSTDVNGDGETNLIDVVRLISFIFRGGPPIVEGILE